MSRNDPRTIGITPQARQAELNGSHGSQIASLQRRGSGGTITIPSFGSATGEVVGTIPGTLNINTAATPQITRVGVGAAAHATTALTLQSAAMGNKILNDTAHGEPQYYFGEAVDATRYEIRHGTSLAPVTVPGPTLKISRTEEHDGAAYAGSGTSPIFSAMHIVTVGTVDTTAQVAAAMFVANTYSDAVEDFPFINPDATAFMAHGNVMPGGTGLGLAIMGRGAVLSSAAGAHCTAGEFHAYNGSGGDHAWTDTKGGANGYGSRSMGLWVVGVGTHRCAAAVQIGQPGGFPGWDVGIGITGASPGGQGNSILSQSFRDDGSAITSLYVAGNHTYALAVSSGGGKVSIGQLTTALATKAFIKSSSDAEPALLVQTNSVNQTAVASFATLNAAGTQTFQVYGESGNTIISGAVQIADNKNIILGSTLGNKIGTAITQKLAFWNATPIVQPTATGMRGHSAAEAALLTTLATTGLIVDSTTANDGSTTPQYAGIGIGQVRQAGHAMTISGDDGPIFLTNYGVYTVESNAYLQAQRYEALTFTGRRALMTNRTYAKGTRSVSDGWANFSSTVADRTDVVTLTLTSLTTTNGQNIVLNVASGVSGNIAAGDRIAVWGAAGTQEAAVNTYHTVTSVSGDTQITIPVVSDGTALSGGQVTNSPYLVGATFAVAPRVERSISSGGAHFGNDVVGIAFSNIGTARATDGIYFAEAPSLGSASAWMCAMTVDTNVDNCLRFNGILSANGAAFDTSSATIPSTSAALRMGNTHRITAKNAAGSSFHHLLSLGSSDQVLLSDGTANIGVWGAGAAPTASNTDGRVMHLRGTAANTAEIKIDGVENSSKVEFRMRALTSGGADVILRADVNGTWATFGTITNHALSLRANNAEVVRVTATALELADAKNIKFTTTATGTKIGTATGELFAFHGHTPKAQQAALTARDATALSTGGAAVLSTSDQTVIDNMRTRINELESRLNMNTTTGKGLIAGTA